MIDKEFDGIFLGGGYKLVGEWDSSKSIELVWNSGFIMEYTPLKLGYPSLWRLESLFDNYVTSTDMTYTKL